MVAVGDTFGQIVKGCELKYWYPLDDNRVYSDALRVSMHIQIHCVAYIGLLQRLYMFNVYLKILSVDQTAWFICFFFKHGSTRG